MISNIPSIRLNNGQLLPMLGLGVYKAVQPGEVESAIFHALNAGYRAIDTASVYKNEEGVGRAIRNCELPREELFITTKVWNNAQRMCDIEGAFKRSLERLQLDYIDLYLIHWPVPGCYKETWKVLNQLYETGKIKSIGVSNFDTYQLRDLASVSDIVPAVNQIEFHPYFYQEELLNYCQEHQIAVQAYAPLARGAYLDDEILQVIADRHRKTTAQVGLRWSIQKGVSVIPKSTNPERIKTNCDIFNFSLTDEEMDIIDGLNRNYRSSSIPEDMR